MEQYFTKKCNLPPLTATYVQNAVHKIPTRLNYDGFEEPFCDEYEQ
jgi:hypothetical protein